MIRVVIAEDEGVAARRLFKMLEYFDIEVIATIKSNAQFQSFIDQDKEPDLYFLDIHLSDGIVFDTLSNNELQAPIIFTTAYDEFAIKAFKQKSIDYLLKPVNLPELEKAIEQYKTIFQQENLVDIHTLSQYFLQGKMEYRSRIKVKIGERYKSIKLVEVPIIYSQNHGTFITTNRQRSYPLEYTIDEISKELDPKYFIRVNRGQILNIDFITDVIAYSNSRLKVVIQDWSNIEVIIARERVKEFKKWLG